MTPEQLSDMWNRVFEERRPPLSSSPLFQVLPVLHRKRKAKWSLLKISCHLASEYNLHYTRQRIGRFCKNYQIGKGIGVRPNGPLGVFLFGDSAMPGSPGMVEEPAEETMMFIEAAQTETKRKHCGRAL